MFNTFYSFERFSMTEDQYLLKCLRYGEKDAVRLIYEKYREDLFTVAASLLHDIHASEDCVQDVFVGFAESAHKLNIRHNLKGYLISCAANRARNYLKKKSVQLKCSWEDSGLSVISRDPAGKLINCEESARIFNALIKLPYPQREVFVLHVQGDMKFRQIAKLQKVSIKTAQSRYRYAIEKLQLLLKKEPNNED